MQTSLCVKVFAGGDRCLEKVGGGGDAKVGEFYYKGLSWRGKWTS